jgi:hypothetical protein
VNLFNCSSKYGLVDAEPVGPCCAPWVTGNAPLNMCLVDGMGFVHPQDLEHAVWRAKELRLWPLPAQMEQVVEVLAGSLPLPPYARIRTGTSFSSPGGHLDKTMATDLDDPRTAKTKELDTWHREMGAHQGTSGQGPTVSGVPTESDQAVQDAGRVQQLQAALHANNSSQVRSR